MAIDPISSPQESLDGLTPEVLFLPKPLWKDWEVCLFFKHADINARPQDH
jgi:hypothetical protein